MPVRTHCFADEEGQVLRDSGTPEAGKGEGRKTLPSHETEESPAICST